MIGELCKLYFGATIVDYVRNTSGYTILEHHDYLILYQKNAVKMCE